MEKLKIYLGLCILAISPCGFAQDDLVEHQLDSLVIRSFTAESGQALAGIKGGVGEGLVYKCAPGTWNWQVTNSGKPLAPDVQDVQTVSVLNDTVFLAGTWKNGLYRTSNAGKTWQKLDKFPSNDVRSIKRGRSGSYRIYAATTSHGIQCSTDLGRRWNACAPDSMNRKLAAWSIEVDPKNDAILYAMTFENGIMRSVNHGKTWSAQLAKEGVMFFDLAISKISSSRLLAAGSNEEEGFLFESNDFGNNWELINDTPEALLSQVAYIGETEKGLLLGSWNKGAFIRKEIIWKALPKIAHENISEIYTDNFQLVFSTWGDGIYVKGKRETRTDLNQLQHITATGMASVRSHKEVILSRKVKRNQREVVVKGYTQEIVGYRTLTDVSLPIYGKKKKFKRIEPYVRDTQIRKKFGI